MSLLAKSIEKKVSQMSQVEVLLMIIAYVFSDYSQFHNYREYRDVYAPQGIVHKATRELCEFGVLKSVPSKVFVLFEITGVGKLIIEDFMARDASMRSLITGAENSDLLDWLGRIQPLLLSELRKI